MNDIKLNDAPIDPALVNPAISGSRGYSGGAVNEWTPIGGAGAGPVTPGGTDSFGFDGHFDGGGNTLYNAFYNQQDPNAGREASPCNLVGIFGSLFAFGSLKNLNTADGYIGGNISVGGIVGRSWAHITNCHNGNFVYGIRQQGAGGVVGTSWGQVEVTARTTFISFPRIDRCSNSGTVVSNFTNNRGNPSGAAGGIVGENEGPVVNCWNTGLVSGLFNAAGIVGSNQDESSEAGDYDIVLDTPAYVNNCYNTGNIGAFTGLGSIPAIAATYAGGIIGFQTGSCQNVYNIGTISAGNTGGVAGQIIGELSADTDETNDYLYIFAGATPNAPMGLVQSGDYSANLFTDDEFDLEDLTRFLNGWIGNNAAYIKWTQDASNWPVFSRSALGKLG